MFPSSTLWLLPFFMCWISLIDAQADPPVLKTKWRVYEYPNPRLQPKLCGRITESLICDPNGIISEKDANDIDKILNKIYTDTRCDCQKCQVDETGYVVMVAILPLMHRLMFNVSDIPTDETYFNARAYAYYLSMYWNFTPPCKENIILLYSRDDDVLYTLTYSDARKYLTDKLVRQVTLRAARHFKDGSKAGIGKGLKQMVQDYFTILREKRITG